jgi:catechol 2,3-dioxygenase-like lactoylglutathione lyase family enzyme
MPIESIDHVQIAMPPGGEDAARNFYGRLLGIPEIPKPPALKKRGGLWFERGALRLHLGLESDFRPARKAHPGLLVRDIQALMTVLRDAGFEVTETDETPDCHRAYVHDPFGNRLEFLEPKQQSRD